MGLVNLIYSWQHFNRQRYVNWRYRHRRNDAQFQLPPNFEPKKVLFIIAGLIGDSVMSTPPLIAARKIWRNSHITVLGRKHNCELLSACPHVDSFYLTPLIPFSLRRRHLETVLKNWLIEQKFDVAISLLGGQFGAVLTEAGIPIRVCSHETLLKNFCTHIYDGANARTWGAANQLESLKCLGYEIEQTPPQLWVQPTARETARQKLCALGLSENQKYVAVHPFGSTPRQWWRLENTIPLAQTLKSKHGLQPILLGGNETVASVTAAVEKEFVNTTGQLTLPELLAVIDDAKMVISTDSGPFHIAGALSKPIIGLFRARRPEHAGQYPTAKVVFGENEVCQARCRWDYCRANPCKQMGNLDVSEVLQAADSMLSKSAVERVDL